MQLVLTVTLTIKTEQKTVLDNNTCTNTKHKSFSRLDFIIIMTDMTNILCFVVAVFFTT